MLVLKLPARFFVAPQVSPFATGYFSLGHAPILLELPDVCCPHRSEFFAVAKSGARAMQHSVKKKKSTQSCNITLKKAVGTPAGGARLGPG
jgi:hypothetical protein